MASVHRFASHQPADHRNRPTHRRRHSHRTCSRFALAHTRGPNGVRKCSKTVHYCPRITPGHIAKPFRQAYARTIFHYFEPKPTRPAKENRSIFLGRRRRCNTNGALVPSRANAVWTGAVTLAPIQRTHTRTHTRTSINENLSVSVASADANALFVSIPSVRILTFRF